jgi:methionine-gamma-lyase
VDGFATKCIQGFAEQNTGAFVTPIYQTSTFEFDSVKQGADRFLLEDPGMIYTRLGNPTVSDFERRMSLIENAEYAVAFGSGMAALSAAFLALCKEGKNHFIIQSNVYGCTYDLAKGLFSDLGIEVSFFDIRSNYDRIKELVKPHTRGLFIETLSNPQLFYLAPQDVESLADIAHKNGFRLIVDNTMVSPYYQTPLCQGADIVIHSVTKYISGHAGVIAGVALCNDEELMTRIKWVVRKNLGGVMSPNDAYLCMQGMKTMDIRMEKHTASAKKIARFLENHPLVSHFAYPGIACVIAFDLKDGYDAGVVLMESLSIIHLAVSFGAADSLIQHPASMTHSALTREERESVGVGEGYIRFSVGLEDVDDLIEDLIRGFEAVQNAFHDKPDMP